MSLNKVKKNVPPGLFGSDQFETFELDQNNCDWVKDLLVELNENALEKTPEAYLDQTNLDIKLSLKCHMDNALGTVLLAKAFVKAHYATSCTISLVEMFEDVEFNVEACFIPEIFEESEEYKEETETFIAGSVKELYFLSKNQADLGEFIHEHLFLNINPYPQAVDTDGQETFFEQGKLKN